MAIEIVIFFPWKLGGFSPCKRLPGRVYPCISQDKNNWGLRWPDRRKTVVEFTAYWNLQIKDRSDWRKVSYGIPNDLDWEFPNSNFCLEKESQRCFNAKNFMLISSDGSTCFSWGLFRGGWCRTGQNVWMTQLQMTRYWFFTTGDAGTQWINVVFVNQRAICFT
jgi:hypothetical protein